ncbi:nucleoside transporter C-terminal domain-containing protein [Caulobacter segnis]|uniref:NupC/NupG family nucleoside CNT transporter n=1 Tax=Caulobacter segnis TaxID=88688 RepID=UPI00286631FE|nr:nucleoside transporter C-terminal domain-containing protein [Caulobacter segnis]MDR6625830.1 CNT family concentrative nucleoside transporter [Caulobacter segnis]
MADNETARALLGVVAFLGLGWLLSENKRAPPWRAVLVGLSCQVGLALLLTKVPAITAAFAAATRAVDALQAASRAGSSFMFGYLGGGRAPFSMADPSAAFIFAFQALPAILLVGALSALLWHWRVLIVIVRAAAWAFGKLFGVSGPVGVSTSACVFLGMVEAPLLIKPFLPRLTRAEIFIIMVDGLSVIGGSMMIVLGSLISAKVPNAFSHLLIASLISTPMAIGMARLIIPGEASATSEPIILSSPYRSSLEALTFGTLDAVKMVLNIAGLLIVFVGLIALINMGLAALPHAGAPLTLGAILGWLLTPIVWLTGAPLPDLRTVGAILGTKVAANEVVAYSDMMALPPGALSDKSLLILTYALGSFGNVGSVAILIGSLSAMAPDKVGEVVELGFKALAAAFLTICMTATIMGLIGA